MNKQQKLFSIYALLLPFIDLITSLMTRFNILSISLGMIVRGITLIFFICYVFFFSKSKYKKNSCIYLGLLFVFSILYFITKIDILHFSYLLNETVYMIKYLYFPIALVGLINIYDDFNFKKDQIFSVLSFNLLIYSFCILIPELTGTAFSSYVSSNAGTVGWFYSANEIGTIMIALFPYLYYRLFKRKYNLLTYIIFFISVLALSILGTKTSFLGLLLAELLFLVYYLINKKCNKGYGFKISFIIIIATFVFIPNIPAFKNLQNNININEEPTSEIIEPNTKIDPNLDKIVSLVLSSRNIYFYNTAKIYGDSKFLDKFFGIGFVNRNSINNKNINKLIEIDFLDIFFHYGILGFFVYFVPLFYIAFKVIKLLINKKNQISFFELTNLYSSLIIILVSSIAGHVFGAPAVSFYPALFITMLYVSFVGDKNITSLEESKKVTIMSLHLGFGGVEKYISSLCKMLENEYDIEIICTYKLSDKPAFEFSDRIKIKYLIPYGPNKDDFKLALKNKNVINIFKEGYKSFKILLLKRIRNINVITKLESDYIITTRYFHNRLVSIYASDKIIKIATEHNYHNDDNKYVNKLLNSIVGYDYFVVVSESLREFYSNKIGNTKCLYIPNVLDEFPLKQSKLQNINMVNVGRFSKEKGHVDLIEVMSIVKKDISNFKLYLIGDGSEKENIVNKIKEYDLENNVILTGFLNKKEMEKYFLDSSLFVLTSYTESFGLVIIEAMSYGLPVIAFDSADGARNLLSNSNGVLISNRDKEKMANEIKNLLSNKNKREKIGKQGYEFSKEFSMRSIKQQWIDLMEKCNENK